MPDVADVKVEKVEENLLEKFRKKVIASAKTPAEKLALKLSAKKLERLASRGLLTAYKEDPIIEGSEKFLPSFRIISDKDKPILFNGTYYSFLDLHKLRLNNKKCCGKKVLGLDIEYYIGGSPFRRIGQHMKRRFKDSGDDHGGEVLEHRPQATNMVDDLCEEVESYYNGLNKIVSDIEKDLKGKSESLVLLLGDDVKPPSISFNKYYVGCHLHLHMLEKDKTRVLNLLHLLSIWHNSKNKKLWEVRLNHGYGKILTDSDVIRDAAWNCGSPNHYCCEFRAFNSAEPKDINELLKSAYTVMKNRIIVAPIPLLDAVRKDWRENNFKMNPKPTVEFLKEVKVIA